MSAGTARARATPGAVLPALVLLLAPSSATCAAATATSAEELKAGSDLFMQNCSFCHGRDARGGDVGPDLLESPLVQTDTAGEKIARVIREGRFGTAMPSFKFSSEEEAQVIAFLHAQAAQVTVQEGDRGTVRKADLETGNPGAGEKYFRGPGGCTKCHSTVGDLAGIASRYEGLQLLRRMLNPQRPARHLTVSTDSGKTRGTLEYLDEFIIGLRDETGTYHSWRVSDVSYQLDVPLTAHSDLLQRYSDQAIHDLYAYLETLK